MSILSGYVTDMNNDGNYTLNLGYAETKLLWKEIDALEAKVAQLKENGRPPVHLTTHDIVVEIWKKLDRIEKKLNGLPT